MDMQLRAGLSRDSACLLGVDEGWRIHFQNDSLTRLAGVWGPMTRSAAEAKGQGPLLLSCGPLCELLGFPPGRG